MKSPTGIGVADYRLAFCINNRPLLDDYAEFDGMRAFSQGELHYLVSRCSNHWRKLFNVMAKVLFELGWHEQNQLKADTWQDYRDAHLLQPQSREALLFTPPPCSHNRVHIVAGKTYGLSLPWSHPPTEVATGFFLVQKANAIISPYLDYRQLSNEKIGFLTQLLHKQCTF